MVRLYLDRRMLDHVPPARHPECPERLIAVIQHLDRQGYTEACRHGEVRPATDAELLRVHDEELIREIAVFEELGGGLIDADTWDGPGSNLAARLAAGAAIEAVRGVVSGQDKRAFCVVRPPGHHATASRAMGFCLFNTAAVAAAEAVHHLGLNRVIVVDWDVHHGNGTQDIFYEDGRVGFFSVHRYPFYPGTGSARETGQGRGLGWIRNLPVAYGTPRKDYLAAFRASLEALADHVQPELIILSAGFDAHAQDPVGSLGLETEDFETMTADILAVAATHAQGRLVSLLEGGYHPKALAESVAAHLEALGVHPVHHLGPH